MKYKIYNVLNKLKEIALSGMTEVYIGSVYDVDDISVSYPLLIIDQEVNENQYKDGVIYLNLDLYFVDIYNEFNNRDLNKYKRQLQSDMLNISIDYIDYLVENEDYNLSDTDLKSFRFFSEKWTDDVAGVKVSIKMEVPNDSGTCENIFNI